MLRLRRYRVFLIFSLIIIALLYQVSKNSHWEPAGPSPYDPSHWASGSNSKAPHDDGASQAESKPNYAAKEQQPKEEQVINIPKLKTTDEVKGGYGLPTPVVAPPVQTTFAVGPPEQVPGSAADTQDDRAHVVDPAAEANPTETTIHWRKLPEHFPVPEESLIMLPTGKPTPIPRVQFKFEKETASEKATREKRLAKIKTEAERAWSGYKKYAWTHDEVKPVSKEFRDPFCGWAATLVDTLDTLWIMDMKDEFDDAVQAVKMIDFTTTPYRTDIPVFETVIRYLGGLLAAYDVSGGHDGKYKVLLDKAVELAEILMGVFDTPNRMPVLYYAWAPAFASQPKRASSSAGVAELGSLSMEFTHLAQLTGKNKYYDAVARITDALEDFQNRGTAIPGIFPESIDASGCNRSATLPESIESSSSGAKAQAGAASDVSDPPGYEPHNNIGKRDAGDTLIVDHAPVAANGLPAGWDCVPQGLTSGGYQDSFSMGGSQDSTYEYFPKQYLLLGGLVPKYRTIHEKVVQAVKKHLLYRPMTKDNRDILFSAKAVSRRGEEDFTFTYEVTHLTCFLGGMFGLGGKIFDNPEDVEVGKLLAAGCAWAYEVFPSGIMPEASVVVPCPDAIECRWNETHWWNALDDNASWRENQMREYETKRKAWEEEMEQFKKDAAMRGAAEAAAKDEALRKQTEQRDNGPTTGPRDNNTSPSSVHKRQATAELGSDDTASVAGPIDEKVKALEAELDLNSATAHQSHSNVEQVHIGSLEMPREPDKPITHEEYVKNRIAREHLQPGFVKLLDQRYILRYVQVQLNRYLFPIPLPPFPPLFQQIRLGDCVILIVRSRPEAIESVWYMYRITGDPSWQEKGWKMFEAVIAATQTPIGHSAIDDVTNPEFMMQADNMESFWLAETLKYFYLLFTTPDVISLDEWVLNTEAHPFKRPT